MLTNYLKITLRNLVRNKLYTSINILGLSIGMLVCILIYLFLSHELSFDQFHAKSDRIYRLNEVQTFGNVSAQKVALSMPLMGETIKEEFPEVEQFSRFHGYGQSLCRANGKELFIDQIVGVDSTFFELFDFVWLEGNQANALIQPNSMVITQSVARNFFGAQSPVGRTIRSSESGREYAVTGIIEDVPENSHLQFDALMSLSTMTADSTNHWMFRWGSNFLVTYFLLRPDANLADMEKRFPDYLVKHMGEEVLESYELYLQPFEEVHLASTEVTHDYHNYKKFDRKYVDLFTLLALFVLIIASINFMNLSTARALHRAKEVGVRKTIGATKSQLIWQFLGESVALSVIALAIAILLGELLVGSLNNLADRQLELKVFSKPVLLGSLFLSSLLVGLFSGLLPAILLASISPLQAIQQKAKKLTGRKFDLRSGLVLFQFVIAIALIVGTFIVMQQYNFMKNLDVGFDREQVVLVDMNDEVNEKFETIRQQFTASPNILGVTASGQRLGNNLHQTSCTYETPGGIEGNSSSWLDVDHDYLSFYNLEMLHGRSFSKEKGTDLNHAYIVNEKLAEAMGWDDPTGKKFTIGGGDDVEFGTIIGVAKDFNYNSLHHAVEPLFLCWRDWGFSEISVRLDANNVEAAIAHLESEWSSIMGSRPFEFEFLDEHFAQLYQSEKQVTQVATLLAILAIFIACLGLFGLATISTEQRVKEIGIRKVLGATTASIVGLLSKDFLKLVGIALVVASPLAYYLMGQWLMDFAFRIDISWWVFAVAGLVAIGVAFLTIGFQSMKAAAANPVDSLRSE